MVIKMASWAAVLLGMVLIFTLSSQVAEHSNKLSTVVTEVIVKAVEKVAPRVELDVKSLNNTLRKNVHFLAFLILGVLTVNALKKSGLDGYRCIVPALVICILYAVSDELHQLFVPGRGGQLKDIIIDSAGAAVGIGLWWVRRSRCR